MGVWPLNRVTPIIFFLVVLFSVLVLVLLLIFLGNFIGQRALLDREKRSPFECGFTPRQAARLPFSLRFFLIAIVFLIFDVELVLIFPIVISLRTSMGFISFNILIVFIMALIAGLYYELNQGRLS